MALNNILKARQQVQTGAGAPLAGGKVFLYEPGTTTFIRAFRDSGLVVPYTNPIRLSGSGRANIWISRDCDLRITDRTNLPTLEGNLIVEELNANPDALGINEAGGLIANGSFEIDTDADLIPNNWVLVDEAGSTNELDTSESTDGAQSFRFTSSGVGGGSLTTEDFFPVNDIDPLRVNVDLRSTVAAVRNIVRVEWYDISQVFISNSDVYDSTANPLTFTTQNLVALPPALARFAKLKLIGIDPSVALAGSTFFDRSSVFYPAVVTGVFDNITIQDNEIISTNIDGHIELKPNGTGSVEIIQGTPTQIDLVDEEVPAFIGTAGGQHVEFDNTSMQSKSDATTAASLSLNALGGAIELGDPVAAGLTVEADGNVELRSATSTDAEVRRILLAHADGTLRAVIGYGADDILLLQNQIHGSNLQIAGEEAGGATRLFIDADPDGAIEQYHPGSNTVRLRLQGSGRIAVRSDASTDTEIRQIVFEHQDGTDRARIGHEASDILTIRNEINNGEINIVQQDGAGADVIAFTTDASSGQTSITGANVVSMFFANGENAFRAQVNSFASMYFDGQEQTRTTTSVLGALTANNLLTGAGFERVATESDVGAFLNKTADQLKTTNTTMAADTHLRDFALEDDTWYEIEGYINWQHEGGQLKTDWSATNTPQNWSCSYFSVNGAQETIFDIQGSVGADMQFTQPTEANNGGIIIRGMIQSNATTGGTISWRWAQLISDADPTTVFEGSWIKFKPLDL